MARNKGRAGNMDPVLEGQRVSENIFLCPDGKYRWIYEFSMWRNPSILMTIFSIFFWILLGFWAFSFLFALLDGNPARWIESLLDPGMLGLAPIFFMPLLLGGLSLAGYVVVASLYGWKYMVLFEMDEEDVIHIQMPSQFAKAQALGWLTAMAGAAANRPGVTGAGLLAASKNSMESRFSNVRKVIGRRGWDLIKVNALLGRNQIYASGGDYDFVWAYITSRCSKAKIR